MRELSGIEGVGQVSRMGGVNREVRVDLDPDKHGGAGRHAADVSGQLVRTQVELPGGDASCARRPSRAGL